MESYCSILFNKDHFRSPFLISNNPKRNLSLKKKITIITTSIAAGILFPVCGCAVALYTLSALFKYKEGKQILFKKVSTVKKTEKIVKKTIQIPKNEKNFSNFEIPKYVIPKIGSEFRPNPNNPSYWIVKTLFNNKIKGVGWRNYEYTTIQHGPQISMHTIDCNGSWFPPNNTNYILEINCKDNSPFNCTDIYFPNDLMTLEEVYGFLANQTRCKICEVKLFFGKNGAIPLTKDNLKLTLRILHHNKINLYFKIKRKDCSKINQIFKELSDKKIIPFKSLVQLEAEILKVTRKFIIKGNLFGIDQEKLDKYFDILNLVQREAFNKNLLKEAFFLRRYFLFINNAKKIYQDRLSHAMKKNLNDFNKKIIEQITALPKISCKIKDEDLQKPFKLIFSKDKQIRFAFEHENLMLESGYIKGLSGIQPNLRKVELNISFDAFILLKDYLYKNENFTEAKDEVLIELYEIANYLQIPRYKLIIITFIVKKIFFNDWNNRELLLSYKETEGPLKDLLNLIDL